MLDIRYQEECNKMFPVLNKVIKGTECRDMNKVLLQNDYSLLFSVMCWQGSHWCHWFSPAESTHTHTHTLWAQTQTVLSVCSFCEWDNVLGHPDFQTLFKTDLRKSCISNIPLNCMYVTVIKHKTLRGNSSSVTISIASLWSLCVSKTLQF